MRIYALILIGWTCSIMASCTFDASSDKQTREKRQSYSLDDEFESLIERHTIIDDVTESYDNSLRQTRKEIDAIHDKAVEDLYESAYELIP